MKPESLQAQVAQGQAAIFPAVAFIKLSEKFSKVRQFIQNNFTSETLFKAKIWKDLYLRQRIKSGIKSEINSEKSEFEFNNKEQKNIFDKILNLKNKTLKTHQNITIGKASDSSYVYSYSYEDKNGNIVSYTMNLEVSENYKDGQ